MIKLLDTIKTKIENKLVAKELRGLFEMEGSCYVSWTKHDMRNDKELKLIENPREVADKVIAETFDSMLLVNADLDLAYNIKKKDTNRIELCRFRWSEYLNLCAQAGTVDYDN